MTKTRNCTQCGATKHINDFATPDLCTECWDPPKAGGALSIYVGNEESLSDKTPIAAALPQLTPEYIDSGQYCSETVLDLVRCCSQLLQDNAKLRLLNIEDAEEQPDSYPVGKMGHKAFTAITKTLTEDDGEAVRKEEDPGKQSRSISEIR